MKQAKNIGLSLLGVCADRRGHRPDQGPTRPAGDPAVPALPAGRVWAAAFSDTGWGDAPGEKGRGRPTRKWRGGSRSRRTDERNVMIGSLAKAKGYDMMTYVFGALMVAFALMGAEWTVIIAMVVAYLFVHGYAIYFRVKLEKEM